MKNTTDFFNLILCFVPLISLVAFCIYRDCKIAISETTKTKKNKKQNKSKNKTSNGSLETNSEL